MSLMEKDQLVENHRNMAFSILRALLEENVPFAVANTLVLLGFVGTFNMFAKSKEISPYSVQH